MMVLRGVYAAMILMFAIQGNWSVAVFHSVCFLGSLFVPYLGKDDESYYLLDMFIVLTFLLSLVSTYFMLWPRPQSILDSILGFDKLFHMAGGAALAMFAAIQLRKRCKDPLVLYIGIVIFALALGAAWEIFEWFVSVLPPPIGVPSSGYMDSMLDICADTLGATILAVVLRLRRYL